MINYENQKRSTLVDQLSSAVRAYIESGGAVDETLTSTLDALGVSFPDHIWKEDYLLLPMAEKVLSEEDKRCPADSLHLIESTKGIQARQSAEKCSTAIRQCLKDVSRSERPHAA